MVIHEEDFRETLRALVEARGTQAAAARKLGVSESYFSDLLAGRRAPSARVLALLGLRRAVVSTTARKETR